MINKKPRNKFFLVIKWITSVVIVQLILINISAAFHAYRFTHYYDSDKVRNLRSSAGKPLLRTWRMMVGRKLPKSIIQYYPSMPYDTVQLTTSGNLKLEAWYMKADSSSGTVILFHGLNSNKGNILNEAYEFLGMGYNTMLVDIRAHGNSEGIANSLGYDEAEEVKLAYDHIKSKGEKNIILWGMSLGAVIITRAIEEYDLNPEKIILEMPFNRLQDHLKARARLAGFPEEPFGFFVTFWSGIEQGYWGFAHKTASHIKKTKCPVLLQWGAKDEYVKRSEIEKIFSAIPVEKKRLIVYEDAGHVPLISKDNVKWKQAVSDFLSDR